MMVVKKKARRHRHVPVRAMLVATIVPAGLTAQVPGGPPSNLDVENATFRASILKEVRP